MLRAVIVSESVIGAGSGCRGRALLRDVRREHDGDGAGEDEQACGVPILS
jgi:hypothetical protein